MPQYNEVQYNESQYNVNLLTTTLTDLASASDADQVENIALNKLETVNMILTLSKLLNNDPFLDDLMPMDETLIKAALLNKLESIVATDANVIWSNIKNAVETMTPSDVRSMVLRILKLDTVFISDVVIKSITNKGLADSVKSAIWLQPQRKISGKQFGDQ